MSNKNKKRDQKRKSRKAAQAKYKRRNQEYQLGIWEQLLDCKIKDVEFPGGRTRKSFRLHLLDGRTVIATERNERPRVSMECAVLHNIGKTSAAVPELIATDGSYCLVQEDLQGTRLSQALNNVDEEITEQLLDVSLRNLATIQQAGSQHGFDQQFQEIGNTQEWIEGLLDRPAVIGQHFKIAAPRPKLSQLEVLLAVTKPRFVKWDSRPGNAMVLENNDIAWFDWEHCGTRNRLDDLAWLLCDEFVPDILGMENRLIDNHLEFFADHFGRDQAREYLYCFGVFHSCVRLGLILSYKEDGSWWDLEHCLSGDKAGVTLDLTQRICYRASRWAKQSELTEMLSPWFIEIAEQLKQQREN